MPVILARNPLWQSKGGYGRHKLTKDIVAAGRILHLSLLHHVIAASQTYFHSLKKGSNESFFFVGRVTKAFAAYAVLLTVLKGRRALDVL